MTDSPNTVLCLSRRLKGEDFLREAKRLGWRVVLVTIPKLEHVEWPRESVDEIFCLPDMDKMEDMINGVSYLARTRSIDRIIPLDDYEVPIAAALREHLRLPGLGETVTRYFRDKLAMRVKAREEGLAVPDFCPTINDGKLHEFMQRVPAPWVLKPRAEAASAGIKKIHSVQEVLDYLDSFGDRRSFYVLEQYVPGRVYHVDSIVHKGEVLFAEVHQYGNPPLDVSHGGIFTTHTVERGSEVERALRQFNEQIIKGLGLPRGVTHIEFIKGHEDGRFYFLEAAARVGGANIVEMVEAATGLNLWREWARLELDTEHYKLPKLRKGYAGIIISLARQEDPDTSDYQDKEIVWRMQKRYHAGLIVAAPGLTQVQSLLDGYSQRFYHDFHASMPALDKPAED